MQPRAHLVGNVHALGAGAAIHGDVGGDGGCLSLEEVEGGGQVAGLQHGREGDRQPAQGVEFLGEVVAHGGAVDEGRRGRDDPVFVVALRVDAQPAGGEGLGVGFQRVLGQVAQAVTVLVGQERVGGDVGLEVVGGVVFEVPTRHFLSVAQAVPVGVAVVRGRAQAGLLAVGEAVVVAIFREGGDVGSAVVGPGGAHLQLVFVG